jgi:hypothetical protein
MQYALRTIALASQTLMRITSGLGAAALILLLLSSVGAKAILEQQNSQLVEVQMRNVMYHFTDAIAVHIQSLHGYLQPTKGEIPVFDDKESFKLKISSAEIAISADSLASVLNSYVFSRHDAPLRGISIRVEDNGRLKVKGKLHNKGDIAFETDGTLSATPDGKIRLHAEKIKALHLPVKGLLDMLGVDLANLVKTGKVQGVEVE